MAVNNALRPIFSLCRRAQPVLSTCARFNSSSSSEVNILNSPFRQIEIPKVTVSDLVYSYAEKWGNHVASECAITGRKYTYNQLQEYSKNLAGALRKKMKFNKGDVIGILLPNSPEYAIVAVGILHGGMIATTFNPIYTPDEISRQLIDSGAKAIITLTDLYPVAKAAVDLTKQTIPILTANSREDQSTPQGAINLKEIVRDKIDTTGMSQATADDVAFMPFSSGTTGLPKGVELTHSNIVSNLCQLLLPEIQYISESTKDHQDVIPAVLPQFHIYGLTVTMLLTLLRGSRTVCLPKFDPKLYIETLVKHKPDSLLVAPPLVIFLSTHDAVKPEYLSSIRSIISGAAPLAAADEQRFLEKAKKDIIVGQGYGLTESSPVIALTTSDMKSTRGSTGSPVSNTQIKILDIDNPTGSPLGPNQTGELLIRGPQVMKGYHNKPKETAETIVDGWLKTGDIAFYDEKGCLTITDRLKELIKVKGFQVPPAELEGVIREYPGVLDVGVIGIPHKIFGEVPKAYVAVKPGTQLNEQKLKEFVKSKVASYKELKGGVSVLESIPKNASGKILRRELKLLHQKHEK